MHKTYKVTVPRAGEGVHSVKINRILKPTGSAVKEDESIIEIETNKATMEIPSPVDGVVGDVFCSENDSLKVGEVLLHVNYVNKEVSVNDALPEKREQTSDVHDLAIENKKNIIRLPDEQIALCNQMKLSQSRIVTANIESQIPWDSIDKIKKFHGLSDARPRPSSLEIIIWAVSQCMFEYEKFRGRFLDDTSLEISPDSLIGIAFTNDNDTLKTPVLKVERSNSFFDIQSSIRGLSKPLSAVETLYHSLTISDMSSLNVRRAHPIVIYPAIATLFIGTPYHQSSNRDYRARVANVALAFDHRAINGAYAAKFLNRLNRKIQNMANDLDL